jgi:hypothetical protein
MFLENIKYVYMLWKSVDEIWTFSLKLTIYEKYEFLIFNF